MIDDFEKHAALKHDIWAEWMKYMFSKGVVNEDGSWTMPKEFVDRWQRQMNTPYDDLSEKEKDSDRELVQRHILLAMTNR